MDLKHFTFLLLILLTVSGCIKKSSITGKEFIPKEVLVEVLTDIHLLEGVTKDRKYYRKYNFNDSIDLMTPIFEKYGITMEQFDTTMAEYSRYPELLDKVYDEVIMKLNVMLDEIDEQGEEAKESPDGPDDDIIKKPEEPNKESNVKPTFLEKREQREAARKID